MAWLNKDFIHTNKATVFLRANGRRLLAGFRIFIHCAGMEPWWSSLDILSRATPSRQ